MSNIDILRYKAPEGIKTGILTARRSCLTARIFGSFECHEGSDQQIEASIFSSLISQITGYYQKVSEVLNRAMAAEK